MDKKKIGIIIGVVLLVVLLIVSCFISPNGSGSNLSEDADTVYENVLKESEAITEEEMQDYTDISVDTYLDIYESSERSLILLGRETCEYCHLAKPILQKISKDYNVEIFYLDTDTFTDDDITNFVKSNEIFNDSFGTPFLFAVENGEIIDTVDGVVDTAHYINFMKRNGFIKE